MAVEPQLACVESLRLIGSRLLSVEAVAVGAAVGESSMWPSSASTISSMSESWIARVRESGRFVEHRWKSPISVPMETLDGLIARYGIPSFCKIDVEGYESEVLAGLSRPLDVLSFEFTPEWPEATQQALSRLMELGFHRFNVAFGEEHRLLWQRWQSASDVLGIVGSERDMVGDIYASALDGD